MHSARGRALGAGAVISLTVAFGTTRFASAQLFGLGAGTSASALSGDGATVAGTTASGYFRWSLATGMQPLPLSAGSTIQSLSGNGAVVFGRSTSGGAFRFDGATTTLYTNVLPVAMSRDGLAMTGMDQFGSTSVRWTTANPVPVTLLVGSISLTSAIDAGGDVIVGSALNSSQTAQAMRWTAGGGMELIGPPAPYSSASASAVTADGSILCGDVGGPSGSPAFRRGPSGVFEILPFLPGDSSASVRAVSDDGSTIVGVSRFIGAGTPVVWTGGSIAALDSYLVAHGLSTAGWTFSSLLAISGDGSVLMGNGTLNGQAQAWVAFTVPPPACYANCDGSSIPPILNVNDFICFQSAFAAGISYANCDGSTVPPVLNVNDFICFQTRFAAGCP